MPRLNANSPLSPEIANSIDLYLASLGMGFNSYLVRRGHEEELARLNALPDGALASMGLTRETLPHHVLRHIFH